MIVKNSSRITKVDEKKQRDFLNEQIHQEGEKKRKDGGCAEPD